jgi:hypothetical protein
MNLDTYLVFFSFARPPAHRLGKDAAAAKLGLEHATFVARSAELLGQAFGVRRLVTRRLRGGGKVGNYTIKK